MLRMTIRTRLLLGFFAAVLVPVIAVGAWSYAKASDALMLKAHEQLDAVASIKRNQVATYFEERQGDVGVLAATPVTAQALADFGAAFAGEGGTGGGLGTGAPEWKTAHERFGPFFEHYVQAYGYYDLFLIDPEGNIVYTAAAESDLGTVITRPPCAGSSLEAAYRGAQAGDATLSDFAPYEPSGGAPAAFVAAPVRSGGADIGVLAFQLSVEQINAIMLETAGMGESGETYLVGADYLMRSDSRFVESGATSILQDKVETEATEAALSGEAGAGLVADYRGNTVLSNYAPCEIEGLNWAIVSEIDLAEVERPVLALRKAILAVAAIATLLFVAMGLAIATGISRGVGRVVGAIREIAEGDGDLTMRLPTRGNDEITELSRRFNQFVDNVHEIVRNAQEASAGVAAAAEQVAASAQEASGGVTQVSAASDDVAKGASSQAGQLEEAARKVEEQGRAMEEIRSGQHGVAQATESAGLAAQAMAAAMARITEIAEGVGGAADKRRHGRDPGQRK